MAAEIEYPMKELDKDGDGQIDYGGVPHWYEKRIQFLIKNCPISLH
jgi:hypothetical protein